MVYYKYIFVYEFFLGYFINIWYIFKNDIDVKKLLQKI